MGCWGRQKNLYSGELDTRLENPSCSIMFGGPLTFGHTCAFTAMIPDKISLCIPIWSNLSRSWLCGESRCPHEMIRNEITKKEVVVRGQEPESRYSREMIPTPYGLIVQTKGKLYNTDLQFTTENHVTGTHPMLWRIGRCKWYIGHVEC